jgi:hypothetical protein
MAKKTPGNIKPALKGREDTTNNTPAAEGKSFSIYSFRTQAIIIAIIGFIFYANTFSHEAAFDDRMAITDNEYVQQGMAGIPAILTRDAYQSYLEHKNGGNQLAGGRYRPLSLITFAIEQQMMGVGSDAGENSTGQNVSAERETRVAGEMHARHVINVMLYILSVIVLLYLLRYIVFPEAPLAAFIAALIFLIHPLHTEVVANVKSRDEILSVLFISLTFIKAFRYYDEKKKKDLWLAVIFFFLALLSKEYAVTMVVLLPLAFYLFRREGIADGAKAIVPYLIPVALYFILRMASVTAVAEGAEHNVMNNPYLYATGMQKIATEMYILLSYLKLLFLPVTLIADYSYNQIPYTDFSNPLVLLSIALHIVMIATMCLLFVRRHVLCFAIAVYLANLALISNIFFDIGAPMGERLIYHSSIGFAIVFGYLLYKGFGLIKQPAITNGALVACIGVLVLLSGFKTIDRNADWKNDVTLFLTDVKKAPNSVLTNNNAAAACMSFAKQAANPAERKEWFEKAIGYFDKAISIYPQHYLARQNRGLVYFNMGMPDKAMPDWDTVRKYAPGQPNLAKYLSIAGQYYFGQGMKYEKANQPDSAIVAYQKCTEATPQAAEPWFRLGYAHFVAGQIPAARSALERALQLKPDYGDAQRLYQQVNNAAAP